MKKIAMLLTCSLLLLATISVSANTYDNHYDFYGKAGPTIKTELSLKINAAVNEVFQIMPQESLEAPDIGIAAKEFICTAMYLHPEITGLNATSYYEAQSIINIDNKYAEPAYCNYNSWRPNKILPPDFKRSKISQLSYMPKSITDPPDIRHVLTT